MRNDLYEHLQRLEVGFHDRWQSGQLLSRASSDLSLVRRFASFGAIFLLVIVVEVLAIFVLLSILYLPLALLTMTTAIPVVVLCRRFERNYHEVVRRIQDQTGDLTTAIEEDAKGIRVIKAFGRGPRDVRALRRAVPRPARHATRTGASAHALHLGAGAHPEPHGRGGAARRCDRGVEWLPSPSAASSRSSPTC